MNDGADKFGDDEIIDAFDVSALLLLGRVSNVTGAELFSLRLVSVVFLTSLYSRSCFKHKELQGKDDSEMMTYLYRIRLLIYRSLTSNMSLNFSAKFGSFRAVTSFIAPFIDFSSDKSLTSSVALTSLSPEISI